MIDVAAAVLAAGTGLGAAVCMALYARVPWWRSATGRHLMLGLAALALVAGLRVARQIWGLDWPGRAPLGLAAWALGCWAAWGSAVLIVRAQRGERGGGRAVRD